MHSTSQPNEGTLTVSEIAAIYGVSSQAIRLYHKEGLLIPVSTDENGYRKYSYNQIYTLATICYLRKLNQPISRIREYIQNDNVKDNLEMLHNAIKEMQEHQKEIQRAINVLEKKLQFVETHLSRIVDDKPYIGTFPIRFYVGLGSEISAANSSAFFKYPTFVQYTDLSSGKAITKFGAFLGSEVPADLLELDQLEVIPKGRYVTAYLKGAYDTIYSKIRLLSDQFSELKLADEAFCVNIVDQFVESSQEAYVICAQIRICDEE